MKYILIIPLLLLAMLALKVGAERQERVECLKWQAQAKQYTGFYLTAWQVEQCANYQIIIK